ncbi:dnaA protein helix-turn-helix [Clostridium cochlearium]|uniref:DnaA protein helix-turn-helix n=1 Tax=Clostridium cochlearium TaxID=1494 RepID=A0ABY0QML1_CLOCO|nr:transposase [Clostridium cochlearium]MCR1972385.1 transposase [Clostridium cochlearium]SDL28098.1 dnaA protein helix-turn-helix [Clostridium cochlearium]
MNKNTFFGNTLKILKNNEKDVFLLPRSARIKTDNSIFHIMVRSISEINLFQTDFDKKQYLNFIKFYQNIFHFKVYAYCLMNNHGHLIIDANGADISKIMHGINLKYSLNFNKRYKRHGHLFQDRFKSKIIDTEKYLITASAYIHNNPVDIQRFSKHPEKYKFSSLAVYLGLKKDPFKIVDEDFVMQFLGNNSKTARKNYINLICMSNNEKSINSFNFQYEKTLYNSERKPIIRDCTPEDIINFVSEQTGVDKIKFYIKNNRKTLKIRALAVILMRGFCDFKCSNICEALGNITQSTVSNMCKLAIDTIDQDENFRRIMYNFVKTYAL